MYRFLIVITLFFSVIPASVYAITDPLSSPNNRFGVHILETTELPQAAKLVNSNGGDWGYVTIPIRADDREYNKWNQFFKDCVKLHLIPIIRLATYVDRDQWVTPTPEDVLDFANFLNQFTWPVDNRYIVLFNEPNHSKEWGGYVSPEEYAQTLILSSQILKSVSENYFIISSGFDMSAPSNHTSVDALEYYRRMTNSYPNWYNFVDGIALHAYPNPGFISSPFSLSRFGISSYRYELNYLKRFGFIPKPVFITETGYLGSSNFYKTAFTQIWTDKNIIAITPFLLFAGAGDFQKFSLLDIHNQPTDKYLEILNLPKTSGNPKISSSSAHTTEPTPAAVTVDSAVKPSFLSRIYHLFFPSAPSLAIGSQKIKVEISDNPASRSLGLSGRKKLDPDTGMLFIFDTPNFYSFWMKDMYFPLDFVWMENGTVVELTSNVLPPGQTQNRPIVINPKSKVNWVLEVNSGFINSNGIKIGDRAVLIK